MTELMHCEKCGTAADLSPKCDCHVGFVMHSKLENRAARKMFAMNLYRQGITQMQIAERIGFDQATISRDLEGLCILHKPPRPQGGRPKGTKTKRQYPRAVEDRIASLILDEGRTHQETRQTVGVSDTVIRHVVAREEGRREAHADPPIAREDLSMTAQRKLDAALRQYQAKLDAQWQSKFAAEIERHLEETVMPMYREKYQRYEMICNAHKGIMPRSDYRLILSCLHPDSRHSTSDAKLTEAMGKLMKYEPVLCAKDPEKKSGPSFPTNRAEWEALRKQEFERRSKRAKEAAAKRTVKRY